MPSENTIIVDLIMRGAEAFAAKAEGAAGSLAGVEGAGKKSEAGAARAGLGFKKLGVFAAGAGIGAGLLAAKVGIDGVKAFTEAHKSAAQTAAVIKSTGGAANVSSEHVEKMTGKLARMSGQQQEGINAGANMLLTFTNIRNGLGKNNKVFDTSTKAVLDLSTAIGEDPKNAAMQLGKALNDPLKGVTALRRIGIQFSDQQMKQIGILMKHNKTMAAQKIILHEVNREFGGSAKAQATQQGKTAVAFHALSVSIGKMLYPAVEAISKAFASLIPFFSKGGAGLKFLNNVIKAAHPIFKAATQMVHTMEWAFKPLLKYVHYLIPVLKVLGIIVGVAIYLSFKRLTIMFKLVGWGIRGLISAIKWLVQAFKDIAHFAENAWNWLKKLADTISNALTKAFNTVKGAMTDVIKWFEQLGGKIIDAIVNGIKSAPGKIKDAIKGMIPSPSDIVSAATGAPGAVLGAVGIHLAGGGVVSSTRPVLVGERGPEIASFKAGTRITSNDALRQLGGGGGEHVHNTHVYLNGREIALAVGRDTANQRARRG